MSYIKFADRELLKEVCECCDKNPLPKDINTWLDKTVFKEHRYIFYNTQERVCCCQNCKNENIPFKRTKYQKYMICPSCHKRMKLRNIKYLNFYDSDYFCYVTKFGEESFILRTFAVNRISKGLTFKFNFREMERCLFKLDFYNSNIYAKQYYRIYNWDWTLGFYKNMAYTLLDDLYVYNKNLKMFKKGCLKYLPLEKLCLHTSIPLIDFFKEYYKFPQLEYLVKLKLYNLVYDFVLRGYLSYNNYNSSENNIKKFLKLETNYYNYLLKHNLDSYGLEALYVLQKLKIKPDESNIEFAKIFDSVFRENNVPDCISFNSLKNYYYKFLKTKDNLEDYKDYLEFAKTLNYDLTDTKYLKPANLKQAHDNAYNKVESIKNEPLYAAVKNKCKQYLKLSYVGKKYSIVMPEKAEDIVQEGIDNHNCVGTYLGRVKMGYSIICFVRHSENKEKSFYTLELDPKTLKIIQCRGYSNGTTSEETAVQKFVTAWRKNIVLKKMKV